MRIKFLLLAILLLFSNRAFAADGDLDASFDGDGKVIASQNSATAFEVLEDIAIQTDGKIVTVGTSFPTVSGSSQQFIAFRFNADGSLDQTFGTGGVVTIKPSASDTNAAESVIIQPDGKILIGGTGAGSFLLARLTATGAPDTTFDQDGKLEINGVSTFGALALEPQTGKIYAGGQGIVFSPSAQFAFTIYRLNPAGSLDTTFGTGGRVQTAVGINEFVVSGNTVDGLAIQPDGKIVAVGESPTTSARGDFTVLRYNSNGALDTSFDTDGIAVTAFGNSRSRALEVALQTDGKIVAVGDQDQTGTIDDLTIVRYNPDGALDASFGTGGKAVRLGAAANESDLVIQPDGKIVFVGEQLANGSETRIFVGRLTANGVLDSAFSGDGSTATAIGVTDVAKAVALQTDGKIVVGGVTTAANQSQSQRKFGIARYLNSAGSTILAPRIADFDGDGKADASVFRAGTWFINPSGSPQGLYGAQFGLPTDRLAPADYDGDGKTDIAIWRQDTLAYFYILQSATGTVRVEQFGQTGDTPATVGDWDGDGRADVSVYRDSAVGAQSYFYYRGSSNNPSGGTTFVPWGAAGDKPMRGDFDGDGRADAAVFRPSNNVWYIKQSSNGAARYDNWGLGSDRFVPADYDGDGKTDLAVFRGGIWYIKQSSDGAAAYKYWGTASDTLVPADYDGDGKTDPAVYRNGIFYILQSSNSQPNYIYFGASGDVPVAAAYVQ